MLTNKVTENAARNEEEVFLVYLGGEKDEAGVIPYGEKERLVIKYGSEGEALFEEMRKREDIASKLLEPLLLESAHSKDVSQVASCALLRKHFPDYSDALIRKLFSKVTYLWR